MRACAMCWQDWLSSLINSVRVSMEWDLRECGLQFARRSECRVS